KVLHTANERRRAHRFLDAVVSHAQLDERQRALAAEIRAMLPISLSASRARSGVADAGVATKARARRLAKNVPRQPRRVQRSRARAAT
ncbi:MAG TPA: hypothetical protein VIL19_03025, partial [Casimicrobiaceae bacterium]